MERKLNMTSRKSVSSRIRCSRRRPGCIRLFVCPTTGGRLEISVSPRETVLGLKAALARKLRIAPTKITLVYKDKVLKDGCIQDHHIPDESHVSLLPHMESGLSLQQSDKSIMQALENLTETQVSDFLSGKSPLMLAIRMGENMVFVQLQLSMLQSQGQRQSQPRQNVTPPVAAVLSQNGLSPAVLSQKGLSPSTIAEATRCLSQKLHRLQEMNANSTLRPFPDSSTSTASKLPQPPTLLNPPASPQGASCPTMFQLPPSQQSLSNLTTRSSTSPPPSPGAIIDSMKHVGRGVYTGTFQGTLDPSLQDGNGQPRRSVSTILHILSDLLVAAPQCPTRAKQGATNMQVNAQQKTPDIKTENAVHAASLSSLEDPSTIAGVKITSVQNSQDDPDNALLRGKMQHIQMLLAQRKEQRRTRREMSAPYTNPWMQRTAESTVPAPSTQFSVSSSTLSTASSVCMAATAAATTAPASSDEVANHGEGSESSSNYCKPNIEQDSVAV